MVQRQPRLSVLHPMADIPPLLAFLPSHEHQYDLLSVRRGLNAMVQSLQALGVRLNQFAAVWVVTTTCYRSPPRHARQKKKFVPLDRAR